MFRKKSFFIKLLAKFTFVWIIWLIFVFFKNNYSMLAEHQQANEVPINYAEQLHPGLSPKEIQVKSRNKRSQILNDIIMLNNTTQPADFEIDDSIDPIILQNLHMQANKPRHQPIAFNQTAHTQVIAPPNAKTKRLPGR